MLTGDDAFFSHSPNFFHVILFSRFPYFPINLYIPPHPIWFYLDVLSHSTIVWLHITTGTFYASKYKVNKEIKNDRSPLIILFFKFHCDLYKYYVVLNCTTAYHMLSSHWKKWNQSPKKLYHIIDSKPLTKSQISKRLVN